MMLTKFSPLKPQSDGGGDDSDREVENVSQTSRLVSRPLQKGNGRRRHNIW